MEKNMPVGKLAIQNFGPIKDATLELNKYVFLIGGQGVGKSALAKMFCAVTDSRLYLVRNNVHSKDVFTNILRELNVLSYLDKETKVSYHDSIVFVFSKKEAHEYRLAFEYSEEICRASISTEGKQLNAEEINTFFFMKALRGRRNEFSESSDVNVFTQVGKMIDSSRDSFYIPAERAIFSILPKLLPALSLAGNSVPASLLYFMIEYNKAKATIKEMEIPLLGVTFRATEDNDYVDLQDRHSILLSEASSGMQSTIPLLVTFLNSIEAREHHNYVIEEPESNLFPDNQIALLEKIVFEVGQRKTETSLMITTHSPYIISYLNVLIRRHAKKGIGAQIEPQLLSVYYVNDDGTLNSLVGRDEDTGEWVVDALDLSEPMERIYDEYRMLHS